MTSFLCCCRKLLVLIVYRNLLGFCVGASSLTWCKSEGRNWLHFSDGSQLTLFLSAGSKLTLVYCRYKNWLDFCAGVATGFVFVFEPQITWPVCIAPGTFIANTASTRASLASERLQNWSQALWLCGYNSIVGMWLVNLSRTCNIHIFSYLDSNMLCVPGENILVLTYWS